MSVLRSRAVRFVVQAAAFQGVVAVALCACGQNQTLPQIRRINEEIRRVWDDHKLHPSQAATDGEWCRRVYLDVLGRVPSVQELRDFVTSREADKKAKLVNKLLNDDAYTEDYARNWTTIWTNLLIGRNGGL